VEHKKFFKGRLPKDSFERTVQIYVRFSGRAGGVMG
jgi:hypothetical protein